MKRSLLQRVVIGIIGIYQKTISPDHGMFRVRWPYGFCRFYPSCSEYTKQAVVRFGIMRGLLMGVKRIIRCNPWTEPQVDQVVS